MPIHVISDQMIRESVREVSGYQKEKINSEFSGFCNRQPDLADFFANFIRKQRPQTMERGFFIFLVINAVFEKCVATDTREIQRITYDEIEQVLKKNETLLSGIKGAHDRFHERIASVRMFSQPKLMKYVMESLETDIDSETVLSKQEAGYLFFVFSIIIELLNDTLQHNPIA